MGLREQLERIREGSRDRIPEDKRAIMERSTESLRGSGIMEEVLKVGDRAPDFSLSNTRGQVVRSEDFLRKGPLVLSFFRGKW